MLCHHVVHVVANVISQLNRKFSIRIIVFNFKKFNCHFRQTLISPWSCITWLKTIPIYKEDRALLSNHNNARVGLVPQLEQVEDVSRDLNLLLTYSAAYRVWSKHIKQCFSLIVFSTSLKKNCTAFVNIFVYSIIYC